MAENNTIEEFFRKRLESHEFTFHEEDWLRLNEKLAGSGIPASNAASVSISVRTVIIIIAALTAAFFLGWLSSELMRNKKNSNGLFRDVLPYVEPSGQEVRKEAGDKTELPAITAVSKQAGDKKAFMMQKLTPGPVPYRLPHLIQREFQPAVETQVQGAEIIDKIPPLKSLESLSYGIPVNDAAGIPALPETPTENAFRSRSPFNGLTVGLLAAPDYNSAGLTQGKTLTPAWGIIVSYRIAPRWSVSARFLYNNKKYTSSGDYYHVSNDYWVKRTNGIVPDLIRGSCRVIDVPVLINYHFYQKRIFSFTASAGLGSYFLLDEKYRFRFRSDNPGAAAQWETQKNSRELFNVVNLAVGLNLRTGPNTSVAVEPYLKVPLSQLGWGKVNLSSMGLAFSLNYHF